MESNEQLFELPVLIGENEIVTLFLSKKDMVDIELSLSSFLFKNIIEVTIDTVKRLSFLTASIFLS